MQIYIPVLFFSMLRDCLVSDIAHQRIQTVKRGRGPLSRAFLWHFRVLCPLLWQRKIMFERV